MKAEKEAVAKGNLELVLAVREEAKGFRTRPDDAEPSTFAELLRMQKIFAEQSAKISAEQQTMLLGLSQAHRTKLTALKVSLTKGNDIPAALTVQEEIKKLTEFDQKLREGMVPKAKAPGVGATLAQVAQSVRAKKGTEEPAENVTPFDAPMGDGRSGAKGILVKSAGGGAQGSTWMFNYMRGGSARGLQVIHPRGKGHAIVHIGPAGIGISTPGEWRTVGYGGGDTDAVRAKDAFEDFFPLEDNREYAIVSRMDQNGSCEVFIDGELVATVRAKSAKPLDLKIPEGSRIPGGSGWAEHVFKGDGLPLEWQENWAGIVVGPLDGGNHVCSAVRYSAGMAGPPQ